MNSLRCRFLWAALGWGIAIVLLLLVGCAGEGRVVDIVIENGILVDGTGSERWSADVAIEGDTIVEIGELSEALKRRADLRIDAEGLVVSPGFIDIHTHSDWTLLYDGDAQSKVRQGVTTEILGESLSPGPFVGLVKKPSPYGIEIDWETLGGYFDRLEKSGISVNVGSFVGATQVRLCVLGEASREPTPEELTRMKELVTESMEQGAFGLSSALLVPPNTYHTTEQLAAMASAVKPFGGLYFTHIRSEGEGIREAIREAVAVGNKAGVPVEIIHLKVADRRMWGEMPEICDLIESSRDRGVKVTANLYPYIAGQNNLVALVPPWAMEGGREKMLERLSRLEVRKRIRKDLLEGIPGWFNHYLAIGDWDRCQVASVDSQENKQFEGKTVAEIADLTGKDPIDAVLDLLIEEGGSVPAVYFLMSEEDLRHAMKRSWVSFGSDGTAVATEGVLSEGKPHPRWYGTFPRILGVYVRDQEVLSLEEAVRKMTSANAEKLGIGDRGIVAKGKKADLVIFNPRTVIDRAEFGDPHHYPVGIEHVIVNGTQVLENGEHLGTRPGKVLRKNHAK